MSENKKLVTPVLLEQAQATSDGAGVKIHRNMGFKNLHRFDPFLLLDELGSDEATDYIGGFPEHPHRGFQTFTYLRAGKMRHSDHLQNSGVLGSGGVQWMKAGSGIIHSEMPEQESGLLHGFQFWVNLPAAQKMDAPAYRDFNATELKAYPLENGMTGQIRLLAGELESGGQILRSPIADYMPDINIYDVEAESDQQIILPVNPEHTAMLYVYKGEINFSDHESRIKPVGEKNLTLLDQGDQLKLTTSKRTRFLFFSGKPIQEPITHWGPFVMNTQEEVEKAMQDYKRGELVQE